MTHREFVSWREYHHLFPIDDLHRIYRPAALIAASDPDRKDINKTLGDFQAWLQPEPALAGFSDADARTLAAFGLKPPARG